MACDVYLTGDRNRGWMLDDVVGRCKAQGEGMELGAWGMELKKSEA